jgi:protein-arginine deiminase
MGCSVTNAGPSGTQTGEEHQTGADPASSALDSVVADLRADSNRDGTISFDDPTDDAGEDEWTESHGAVFLANIDDDEVVCSLDVDDVDLPKCNDAADDKINGADDLLDLARLATKPWPGATADAVGTLEFTAGASVRIFKKGSDGEFTAIESGAALTRDELVAGVELAIEGKDIVRDLKKWDGFTDVTLTVNSGGKSKSDVVRLRVAPVLTYHHALESEATFVSQYQSKGNADMRADLTAVATRTGAAEPIAVGLRDPWMQDLFEDAYMTMPGPNGTQHAIRVAIRSANVFAPNDAKNPLRPGGIVAFALRGKDSAAVQEFDRRHPGDWDTLNSTGNWETIPPYEHNGKSYPMGRIMRGNVDGFQIDPAMKRLTEAQKVQDPLYMNTAWLAVGHVDETLSFVRSQNARGWSLLANDAAQARAMLEAQSQAGRGSLKMFVGKYWDTSYKAEVTIDQVLSDPEVMASSAEAVVEVAEQVEVLKHEIGITDDEIIKVPFLHMPAGGASIAYQPGMVNGLYIRKDAFVSPKPHGPIVGGKDIFEEAMTEALAPVGVKAYFAEDWDDYHRNMGEVHCGTNSTREIPATKWWESGR